MTDRTDVDCVIAGAGVIGLAIARALAQAGFSVIIAERERSIGTGISARNSEVIHAGIYYPEGSLKARFCVDGKRRLYAYCHERAIDHRRCGKLIVATDAAQLRALEQLANAAAKNGVDDLQWLDAQSARTLEPELHCVAALFSPGTGIIDTHALMLALLGDAQRSGATLALGTEITRATRRGKGLDIFVAQQPDTALRTRWLIDCAGLDAVALAQHVEPLPANLPTAYLAKGSYFSLTGRTPFAHLVYPLPEPGGLGVHLTLDLQGRARFGPDVEWIETPDYRVDPARAENFFASIRRYWPALRDGQLQPAYAGIRPKISAPGAPAADFRIDTPAEHGVPGLIALFGIESPGITASLALADYVRTLIDTD